MKRHNLERFVESGVVICTVPKRGPLCEILGYFLVDRCAIARRLRQPIVQDFLAIYSDGSRPDYFSGRAAPGVCSVTPDFCELFGGGPDTDYGCEKTGKGWWCENHRYEIGDRDLPPDPRLLAAIDRAVAIARRDVVTEEWQRVEQQLCDSSSQGG
jgi:hypothetical protein